MTVFVQAVKTGELSVEHLAAGLWIDEDDHGLTLVHTDPKTDTRTEIAHWSIYANVWDIRDKANEWLERRQHGNSR